MPFSDSSQYGWFDRLRHLYQSLSLPRRYAFLLGLLWSGVGHELGHLNLIAERESRHDVINLSQALAEEVSATVASIDLSLIALRSHWRAGPQTFQAFLSELSRNLQDRGVFQIAIVDAKGILQYSSSDAHPGRIDLSDREHVRAQLSATQDRLFISRPLWGRVSHKWSVQFTRALSDERGKVVGVIVASVDPGYFSRFHSDVYLGPQGAVSVSRADGVLLARSTRNGRQDSMTETLKTSDSSGADANAGAIHAVSSVDGIARLYSVRTLAQYGLSISVGESMADARERYASQRQLYVLAGIGISLLLAAMCWIITKATYRREQLLRRMAEAEARWKFALEGAGEGVWDWDIRAQRAYLSPRVMELLGTDEDTLACNETTLRMAVHPDDIALVNATISAHLEGRVPSYTLEHRIRGKDKRWMWILSRGMVVARAPDGRALRMVGTFSDISDRRRREDEVRHQAQHDALTGLPNRTLLSEKLRQALAQAQRKSGKLAVLYFDLDHFKLVNDSHGHEIGDLLLKEIAQRAVSRLRHSDTVARLGGDEFVSLLPDIADEADALAVAADMLAAISAPFHIGNLALETSGSIGVAVFPGDGSDEATLLRCADQAMYQAKQQGRGRVCRYREPACAANEAAA
ncbi:bifunctional diguanylate cyclase/phosphodiesterase [Noviherbaspirillum pedocola]|uniref:Diguanylate cyclase n=1 Tax=Noviherbaspirillum pedocola TaxID=2801341 RepID=A0A934SWB9_9BURK|nr:diguanylate cyclase [Noviherbaspirillum pedocola]MBK4737775.1 diguanylate cyclase [Noviherbaspirillum pedocola]